MYSLVNKFDSLLTLFCDMYSCFCDILPWFPFSSCLHILKITCCGIIAFIAAVRAHK